MQAACQDLPKTLKLQKPKYHFHPIAAAGILGPDLVVGGKEEAYENVLLRCF